MDKTIRFVERAEVDYVDGRGLLVYEEGSVHTLRSDKADRWIRRGKAVEAKEEDLFGGGNGNEVERPSDVVGEDSGSAGGGSEPPKPIAGKAAERKQHGGHRR